MIVDLLRLLKSGFRREEMLPFITFAVYYSLFIIRL